LFIQALTRYEADGEAVLRVALDPDQPLRPALSHLFSMMAQRFAPVDGGSGGCLLFTVAAAETQTPAVREVVSVAGRSLEGAFRARFEAARDKGEIAAGKDPADLAMLAAGLVHSLSTRARAGDSQQTLERVIDVFVQVICGSET
jgi:AcrR family transcriptional regulator